MPGTTRRPGFLPLAAALLLLLSAPAFGAGVRAPGRFDGHVQHRTGGTIATAPQDVERLAAGDTLRAAWQTFGEPYGGRLKVFVDERTGMPTLVTGPALDWAAEERTSEQTLEEQEVLARAFLSKHAALLGDWSEWLVLDEAASASTGGDKWQLVFRLQVGELRVENARLDFHVDGGRLTLFGATHWAAPAIDSTARVTSGEARQILDRYLDHASDGFELDGEAELVLLATDADPGPDGPRRWTGVRGAGLRHRLIWRLQLRDPQGPALWTGEIDAHDGTIQAFYDGAHYAGIRGGVFPEQPDGECAAGGCELDEFPMPFADWTESGQSTAIADSYGNFECVDPAADFETELNGRYVSVADTCGAVSELAGCDGLVQLGLKQGEDCATGPHTSPGNTAAARSSYYHVNRVAEAARFYTPGIAWLDSKVFVNSNWIGSCNASYGGGEIYVYRESGSCANSGEIQGIAVHEWGHGLDQNDGGDWDNTSEAYADMVSLFASRRSCFGPGLFKSGVCSGYGDTCLSCSGFRDHDWAARTANTPATPQGFVAANCGSGSGPCGGEVHCETYPIVEAMFDLATRDLPAAGIDTDTSWQLVERLWYSTRVGSGGDIYTCALPASDSCSAGSWYQRLRSADDDDGDLGNGTPHAAELFAAFDRHGIACGAVADPENQSGSSCPALATPQLTLDVAPAGTELSWPVIGGADSVQVYRGDLGCRRQQIPVATLPGSATGWLDTIADPQVVRSYRIEAIGANPACRSAVSNCETGPLGPRLQQQSYRLVESGPHTNGNGFIDPGETVQLPTTLFNGGTAAASGVRGRLRTVDPTQGRVVQPVAVWSDLPVAAQAESELPWFELTLFESGVACGETVELELEMLADAAPLRGHRFRYVLGDTDREYAKIDGQPIPRLINDPIFSTLELTDDTVIGDLDITLNVSHSVPNELVVELSSPLGTTVRLHDHTAGGAGGLFTRYDLETQPDGPGTMADFAGESLAGTWTLRVHDTVFAGGQGTLTGFTLHVSSAGAFDCAELVCSESVPSAPDGLQVNRVVDAGDGSVDLDFSWTAVAGAAGYHVLQSTERTFDAAVDVTTRTAGATTSTVENGAATTPDLTYFQVRAINGCNEESP